MASYGAYHQHPWNRLTHFVGVPAIIFAILIPMGWLRLPLVSGDISLAVVFVAVVLIYYFLLDIKLALAMLLVMTIMLIITESIAVNIPLRQGTIIAIAAFVGGWIFQIIGHIFEGRRPALADNFWQIFVAPIFLVAELCFALGYRHDVKTKVEDLLQRR